MTNRTICNPVITVSSREIAAAARVAYAQWAGRRDKVTEEEFILATKFWERQRGQDQ